MKTQYIYYGIISAIVVAIGVVVYMVWKNSKDNRTRSETAPITHDTGPAGTTAATADTPPAPAPCTSYTRTSWLQDSSIRPGYVRVDYCDGTSETVPGNF